MKNSEPRTLHDYLALVVRRRWWVMGPFAALLAFSILVCLVAPKVYVSETMIMIEPREVSTDFVKDL